MKYLMALLGLTVVCAVQPALAGTCEQIMEKGSHEGQFVMLDDHTIIIPPSDYFIFDNFIGPQCDIVSFAKELHLGEKMEVNSIQSHHVIYNHGVLKVKNIIIPVKDDMVNRLRQSQGSDKTSMITLDNTLLQFSDVKLGAIFKGVELDNESCKKDSKFYRACTLDNSSYVGKKEIEAETIDVHCNCLTAIHNGNDGIIKAKKIRGVCMQVNKNDLGNTGCSGISNEEFDGKKAVIIAEDITGIGYAAGIVNGPDSVIKARILEGKGWGDAEYVFGYGSGITNYGKIKAQNVKCCSWNNNRCYYDAATINDKDVKGIIYPQPQNSCPQNRKEHKDKMDQAK